MPQLHNGQVGPCFGFFLMRSKGEGRAWQGGWKVVLSSIMVCLGRKEDEKLPSRHKTLADAAPWTTMDPRKVLVFPTFLVD